jgi:hypothetical protein
MRSRVLKLSRLGAVAAVASLPLSACFDQGPEAAPGTFTATVVSPNGAEGAAVLSLFGEGLLGVTAVQGRAFAEVRGDTMRVVVLGDGGALRFGLEVADTTQRPTGVVIEVAGPDDALRASVAGYAVEVSR